MRSLGITDCTQEDIDAMINEADADGNGFIDFEEFTNIMKRQMKDADPEIE